VNLALSYLHFEMVTSRLCVNSHFFWGGVVFFQVHHIDFLPIGFLPVRTCAFKLDFGIFWRENQNIFVSKKFWRENQNTFVAIFFGGKIKTLSWQKILAGKSKKLLWQKDFGGKIITLSWQKYWAGKSKHFCGNFLAGKSKHCCGNNFWRENQNNLAANYTCVDNKTRQKPNQ
jgi:hypothetical protein